MTENTHPTPDPSPEIRQAQEVARLAQAVQALVEGVRAHRAAGPAAALELVSAAEVHTREFVAASVNMVRTLAEHLCAAGDQDIEDYLTLWLAQADRDERAARARLAELTRGDDA